MRSTTLIASLAAAVALGAAGSAPAATFCAGAHPDCPAGTAQTDLQTALSAAQSASQHDVVLVGPGKHTTGLGFKYASPFGANSVEIRGAGRDSTVLESVNDSQSGTFSVLSVAGSLNGTSFVSDLAIVAPGAMQGVDETRGLKLLGKIQARRLRITETGESNGASQGVFVDGGTISDSEIDLDEDAVGVESSSGTWGATVDRSTIRAGYGVVAISAGSVSVRDTRITARRWGLKTQDSGEMTAANVAIRLTGQDAIGAWVRSSTKSTHLRASHLTIHGGAHQGAEGLHAESAGSWTASLALDNSIIAGVARGLRRMTESSGFAEATLSRVNYDGAADLGSDGTGQLIKNDITNHAPGFVDAAAGDLRLLPGSPLIDQAFGDALVDPGATDAAGAPRLIGAVRDLGAFEHQPAAPAAPVAPAETGETGVPETAGGSVGATSGGATPDTTAPTVSALRRRARRVTFSLSEEASVQLRVERRAGGRFRSVGAAKRLAGVAGANRTSLRRLRAGRYRLVVTASDAAGNRSVKRLAFRVA